MRKPLWRLAGGAVLGAAAMLVAAGSASASPAHASHMRFAAVAVAGRAGTIRNTPVVCDQCTITIRAKGTTGAGSFKPANIATTALWDGSSTCTTANSSFFVDNTSKKWGETISQGGNTVVDVTPGATDGICLFYTGKRPGHFVFNLQADGGAVGKNLKLKLSS